MERASRRSGTRAPDGKAGGPLDGGLAGPGQEVTGSCPLFRAVPLYLLCSRVSSLASVPNKSSLVWAINYIVTPLPRGLWGLKPACGRRRVGGNGDSRGGQRPGRCPAVRGRGGVCEIGS